MATQWADVVSGDPVSLRRACRTAVSEGQPIVEVVRDGLAPFQRSVGEDWLHGRRSIASEHEITARVDRIVMELELGLDPARPLVPVICVNAEGDGHGLASRLVALALAAEGHRTAYLGPSLPASELGGAIGSLGNGGVVAITCSTVVALPGAAKSVAVAGAAGCPVVVGGYAFDAVPETAARLGVGHGRDPAVASLEILSARVPAPVGPPPALAAVDHLDLVAPVAIARCAAALGELASGDDCVPITTWALGFLRAALCYDLPGILTDHTAWLSTWLTARNLPITPHDIYSALAGTLPGLLPEPESDSVRRIVELA